MARRDQEFIEVALYKHVYPGEDEAQETEASFQAMIAVIPAAIKRRFGYQVWNEERMMEEEEEIERLRRQSLGNRDHGRTDQV